MNTDELKKLLKGSTAVLILENGEPTFVILGYDAYKGLLSDQEKEVKINHPVRGFARDTVASPEDSNETISNGINRLGPDRNFQQRLGEKESELLEKINKQILALKDEIAKEEKGAKI